MTDRTRRAEWTHLFLAAAVVVAAGSWLVGCAPKAGSRQSALMQQTRMEVSADELRVRVYNLTNRLTGLTEDAADRIREEATDPDVRRKALLWKVEAIPAYHMAAFRPDPLAAAIDVWGLTLQVKLYFEEGAGREAFGPQQGIAMEATARMLGAVRSMGVAVAVDEDSFNRAARSLEEWARANPIERGFVARPSATLLLVNLLGGDPQSAFAAVGQMQDTIEDLSVRLNSFAALLPKQARWQAELLSEETLSSKEATRALSDLTTMAEFAARSQALLDDIPGTARMASAGTTELLDSQRQAIIAAIERQRIETIDFVAGERELLVGILRAERLETVVVLREERIAALADAEAISQKVVQAAVGEMRAVVDYVLLRLALLLGAAGLAGGIAVWIATRPLVRSLRELAAKR